MLCITSISIAQISGNQVTGNSNNGSHYSNNSSNKTSINDNHLTVQVKILLNQKADSFTLVIGTNQEAETVKECTLLIDKRIDGFISEIQKSVIKKESIYVDFISQTKIYDYSLENNQAEQFQKGFEIKKNIIIISKDVHTIEALITIASKYELYDIIKVDYANDDITSKHNYLFEEALKLAEIKKNLYLKSFGKRSVGTPNASEDFSILFPKTQYKKYQAFENSEIETQYRNNNFVKKIARKNTTHYYDGINSSDFDKVINQSGAEIGIQYLLTITITYKLDTSI
jgi:uncharacterized protein YggE